MQGRLLAVCLSNRKGKQKTAVPSAEMTAGHGLAGDAHAGDSHRQVSLLANEDIEAMRCQGLDLSAGAFGENLVVEGLDLSQLGLGSRLRVGHSAELLISQIGKTCHSPCVIFDQAGDCIMPRLGLFARCDVGGRVAPGDVVQVLKLIKREAIQAVILTISDRCSRGEARDTAGPAVAGALQQRLGAHIYRRLILPDEGDQIKALLKHYSGGHSIDVIFTVGGTGMSPRDVTPEATRAVSDRLAPGFDEAMRAASLQHTPHAMLSRGVSGIRLSTLIINLPGSERAATENLAAILPALPHAVAELRGRSKEAERRSAGKEHGKGDQGEGVTLK